MRFIYVISELDVHRPSCGHVVPVSIRVVLGVYGVAIYIDDFDDSVHPILKPEYDTANVHILRVCLIWGYELQPYPLFQVLA